MLETCMTFTRLIHPCPSSARGSSAPSRPGPSAPHSLLCVSTFQPNTCRSKPHEYRLHTALSRSDHATAHTIRLWPCNMHTVILLPPASKVANRYSFQLCLSVHKGSHVTVTHHALHLTVQVDLGPAPPRDFTVHGRPPASDIWTTFLLII